jgi:two-component system response regulator AtoC
MACANAWQRPGQSRSDYPDPAMRRNPTLSLDRLQGERAVRMEEEGAEQHKSPCLLSVSLPGRHPVTRNAIEIARLLVVSRDTAVLRPLWSMGESSDWQLETAANAWEAIERIQSGVRLDLLLLDISQADGDGLHILRWLRRLRPALPIVLIGQAGDAARREECMRMGARDYLVRPIESRQLETVLQRSLAMEREENETEITSDDVEPVSYESFFIGGSPIMRMLRAQAALLAEANVPVLILGENGSGKETTARLLHGLSVRSGFEFAKVNCAALPGDLLERELFGYEKNGATSPPRTRTGKLELCAKGTILLDEITEMPPALQSNLLQVLQNKRFIRPGTSTLVEADVRIVAASSTNVERSFFEHRLREELYHLLSAYTIHVPPLRERKEELPFLSRHFMRRLAKHYGLSPREFSPAIIEAWKAYHWPGNLRELEHCVKRYLLVGDEELAHGKSRPDTQGAAQGDGLSKAHIPSQAAAPGQSSVGVPAAKSLRSLLQNVKSEAEKNAIAAALEKTGWNRKAAARLLKVSYRTVLYKIEQYRMTPSSSSLFPGSSAARGKAPGFTDTGERG